MDIVLKLQGVGLTLTSRSGPVEVLRGIDMSLRQGEVLALIGPSGSGKSSALMLMAGLERASSGRIEALGHDLTPMDEEALARFRRGRLGIIFQNFHLIPTMTALENVALPLELAGQPDAIARARAELDSVGLAHRAGHAPAQLSGGEQQRVAIARALAPRPQILLADEPTGNLDEATGAKVADLLLDMARTRASAMVIVTHSPELAARCDRVLRLRGGQIDGCAP